MDPYCVISDEIGLFHNPQYGKGEGFRTGLGIIGEKVKKWIQFEYFYSWIDKPYFSKNELGECLSDLGLTSRAFRRDEWVLIRKAIGKPRRFSEKFVKDEKERLKRYRESFREIMKMKVLFSA